MVDFCYQLLVYYMSFVKTQSYICYVMSSRKHIYRLVHIYMEI